MNSINLIISQLLILLCLSGLLGLFFCKEYVKRISCLSISYSSFLIFIVVISLKTSHLKEILAIMVTILAIFSANLFIGIGIAKNIAQSQSKKK